MTPLLESLIRRLWSMLSLMYMFGCKRTEYEDVEGAHSEILNNALKVVEAFPPLSLDLLNWLKSFNNHQQISIPLHSNIGVDNNSVAFIPCWNLIEHGLLSGTYQPRMKNRTKD